VKKFALIALAAFAVIVAISIFTGRCTTLSVSRTFHHPIEFQLTERFGGFTLRTIIRSGAGGYDAGPVASDESRKLIPAEVAAVRSSLQAVLASTPKPPGGMLADGSTWSLRVRPFPIKTIAVRSPDLRASERDTQALYDFGLLLWRIAKITEPEKDLY
jgi:hypothetical protein